MDKYQIEYSIKFNGLAEGEEESKEFSFSSFFDVEAGSFDEAEEKQYEWYENDMDEVLEEVGGMDVYYSMEEVEDDAIHIDTFNLVDGDRGSDNIVHIRYPDGSEYYAMVWDQEKSSADEDYEPEEIAIFN